MADRRDFTQDEWQLLSEAPTYAGLIVVLSERGGSFWELVSIADTFAEVRAQVGESRLLDDIAAARPAIGRESFGSGSELRAHGLSRIRSAIELLRRTGEPADVEAVARFIVTVAEAAAGAFPHTAEPVSASEQDAIAAVRAAVGLEAAATDDAGS
jgi:hypothetical protein